MIIIESDIRLPWSIIRSDGWLKLLRENSHEDGVSFSSRLGKHRHGELQGRKKSCHFGPLNW